MASELGGMATTTTDRRSLRFGLELKCGHRVRGRESGFVSGSLSDVSRLGCCLRTIVAAGEVDDAIELQLVTPENGSAEIVGKVVWNRKVADGWELGLEFREIDPAVKWDIIDPAYRVWHDRMVTRDAPPQAGDRPAG